VAQLVSARTSSSVTVLPVTGAYSGVGRAKTGSELSRGRVVSITEPSRFS
jgi:hypothetical protein